MSSGIASEVEALDPQRRDALNARAAEWLLPLTVDGQVVSHMTSNIATAVKAP
jgi:hypothetical protein